MSSIFSKIIAGEIPSYKVAETANYYAFLDTSPLTKGRRDPLGALSSVKSRVSVSSFQVTLAGDHFRMLDWPALQSETCQAPVTRGLLVYLTVDIELGFFPSRRLRWVRHAPDQGAITSQPRYQL